ncbi:orotidine-5'-phosphate decarboxylase [Chloroflexota bacterium]
MGFNEKLKNRQITAKSLVCVGLDSDTAKLPQGVSVTEFNRAIIKATAEFTCAYKINLAFYEAMGDAGHEAIRDAIRHIREDIPVIGDAKRADIGNTSAAYAKAIFEQFGFDAITVNPYMGSDSLQPFFDYTDKGVFVLCRTSNKGSADFQELTCIVEGQEMPLYEAVAAKVGEWNTAGNIGIVVGATYPKELRKLRAVSPAMTFLIPGIGAQGGDLELTVKYGTDHEGLGAIINSSRQIIFASSGKDYASAASKAARQLRDDINRHRVI